MTASTIRELGNAIAELTNRIDGLDQRITVAFKELKGRVNTMETRFDGRMDQLESEAKREVASFGTRIESVATGFNQVNYGMDGMETRAAGRLDTLETKMNRHIAHLETKIDRIGRHFAEYEAR